MARDRSRKRDRTPEERRRDVIDRLSRPPGAPSDARETVSLAISERMTEIVEPVHWRAQHGHLDMIETIVAGKRAAKVRIECKLDAYLERKKITPDEFEAGLKFRRLWRAWAKPPSCIAPYGEKIMLESGKGSSRIADFLNESLDSEAAIKRVLELLTPKEELVVIAVCGEDQWAGSNDDRHRMKRLSSGLDKLARYWRISIPVAA